ncbi:hypothetical protein B0H66DRAFT_639122 [Apodospora peruviana]|uniref:C3H1-type domain-containing protein n=1 Tax=Apodospora peruviana TaxID=516989 RepID=A0AAE0ID20_9PEZI|nr:hypothetical protein B0H66DRAFT_639122 [Apodospora peruviana]
MDRNPWMNPIQFAHMGNASRIALVDNFNADRISNEDMDVGSLFTLTDGQPETGRREQTMLTEDPYDTSLTQFSQASDSYVLIAKDFISKYRHLLDINDVLKERNHQLEQLAAQAMALKDKNSQLEKIAALSESRPFVYLAVDGDGAVFHENYIKQSEEGGKDAAHMLHKTIKEQLSRLDDPSLSSIDDIKVEVFLNVEGLASALEAANIIPRGDGISFLTRFGRGFCQGQKLFSFVDVGRGKERADQKIYQNFGLFEKNMQCKCLILAGCHDNGYATFLQDFTSRSPQKIHLLRTTPMAAEFKKFAQSAHFGILSASDVFRSEVVPSLVKTIWGMQPLPPPVREESKGYYSLQVPANNNTRHWPSPDSPVGSITSVASRPSISWTPSHNSYSRSSNRSSIDATPSGGGIPLLWVAEKLVIPPAGIRMTEVFLQNNGYFYLNAEGWRVDIPFNFKDLDTNKTSQDLDSLGNWRRDRAPAISATSGKLKSRRFCNLYHIWGPEFCSDDNQCDYLHGERLDRNKRQVMEIKARNLPCGDLSACKLGPCMMGHHCQRPQGCNYPGCRFESVHGMDITPECKVDQNGKVYKLTLEEKAAIELLRPKPYY